MSDIHTQVVRLGTGPGQNTLPVSAENPLPVSLAGDGITVAIDPGTKVTTAPDLGAGGSGIIGWLSQIWSALVGVLRVEPLGQPSVPRQVPVTTTSENQPLTATCRRISIKARTCDMRYAVGDSAQTANSTTSHFIEAGERLDIAVPLNGNIAVVRDAGATADGKLCITELI